MNNASAKVIVCEPQPRWAVLWRRFSRLAVEEARSLPLASDLLRERPTSFLLVSCDAVAQPASLIALARWQLDFPLAAWAAVVTGVRSVREAWLYEAGAQFVMHRFQQLPVVIRMAMQHGDQAPQPQLDWRSSLEARLPWKPVRS
jgi:hypothetical protein